LQYNQELVLKKKKKFFLQKMYTLQTSRIICDPEVNFEVPVKGIETHKIYFLDDKFFLGIEKRSVFDQVLLIFQKTEMGRNDSKVCIKG